MANIAITTYCNLKCPYCFADDMICEQHNNISIERFKEILSWIARTPMNHIGIIGGEPTIHPHFDDILKEVNIYCRELNTTATLFTNGIHLDPHIQNIGQAIGLLINVNAPDNMPQQNWSKLNDTLDHLSLLGWFSPEQPKANIGCNLYLDRTDYNFIWDIVDRYHITRVRTSVTAPISSEVKANKEKYYTDMKDRFLQFCKDAKSRNVVLGADCNQIPDCYFTKDELDLVYKVMEGRHGAICNPVIDITPDFKATACFGCYDPVDCRDFETLIDLERYLLHKKTYPRVCANATGKCKDCKLHDLLVCQGGCLAFADMTNGETS